MKNLRDMKIKSEQFLKKIEKKRMAEKETQCEITKDCNNEVSYYDLPDVCYEDEE